MDATFLIARILGPCMLIIGLGIMFNRDFYQRVMEDYFKNAALVFFGGMIALVAGIVIVLNHNVWVPNWPVIITIYGWGGIIKGTWLVAFPNTVPGFTRAYIDNKNLLLVHSVFIVIIGAVLAYFGYSAA